MPLTNLCSRISFGGSRIGWTWVDKELMNPLTILRTTLFVFLMATIAAGTDKTAPTYQKGTITGWEKGTDIRGGVGANNGTTTRNKKVYALQGTDLVYRIDYCGAFQAGKFQTGQAVDFRVDGERLYIRRDDGKEFKCKVEGTKAVESAKPDAPAAKP
jgi:hypothetical protein